MEIKADAWKNTFLENKFVFDLEENVILKKLLISKHMVSCDKNINYSCSFKSCEKPRGNYLVLSVTPSRQFTLTIFVTDA